MAVLVEAISIIVNIKSIDARYAGGWDGFIADIPNKTLCYDDEVARVCFLDDENTSLYVDKLQEKGLCFCLEDYYMDFAVVHQLHGMSLKCFWLEVNTVVYLESGMEVQKCGLKDSTITSISVPDWWKYEGSLSQKFKSSEYNDK